MKHKSPKQLRKKKRNPYILDDIFDITLTTIASGGSRVDRLPPYNEYNPRRIHVARRRRAYKDHHTFPRGWAWASEETGDINVIGSGVGGTAIIKIAPNEWPLNVGI